MVLKLYLDFVAQHLSVVKTKIPGTAKDAGGEMPSEPYVTMCDAHTNMVALFLAKVLKIFNEKKSQLCVCMYVCMYVILCH